MIDPVVTIFCSVQVTCSQCGRSIEETVNLVEDQLRTGNATAKASFVVDEMKRLARSRAVARGWILAPNANKEMIVVCGKCNDDPNR